MLLDPTFLVSPSWVRTRDGSEIATDKPIDYAISKSDPGDTLQLTPGRFRRAGPFQGVRGISINGWDAPFKSTICRDETVGSTDAMILGPNDRKFKFVNIEFEADDRAALKTTSGVGPGVMLVNCSLHGYGNAFEGGWNDNSKWGCHGYDTADWQESNNAIFSIRGEHARYFHNIKGKHTIQGGVTAHCGRTALQVVNRQNEGGQGVGEFVVGGQSIEDVCLEQGGGGSALTFRGGMPESAIWLEGNRARLGCRAALSASFNQNISGVLLVDSSPESSPGAGDAAWPGGTKALIMQHEDYEVGTIYPGKGSAIRPVVKIDSVREVRIDSCRVVVRRPEGAYPIAFEFGNDIGSLQITGENEVVGWVVYKGTKYHSWAEFKAAVPSVFG